jgi:hypothetical protein
MACATISHISKKSVLQEALYQDAITHTELRRERVTSQKHALSAPAI